MKNIYSFPNNVDQFTGAEHLMRWFHGRTSGVWGAGKNAAVTPAADNSMKVAVSDGLGWLSNSEGDGIVWWINTEKNTGIPMMLEVLPADGVLNRIDRVVVTWETYDYSKLPSISILKGQSTADPKPPEITNNKSKRQISLAQIAVPSGTVKITPALITDERLDPAVCGIVTDSMEVDTSVMQAQFAELLTQMKNDLNDILTKTVPDGAVSTSKISDGAVTTKKISENAVVQEYEASIPVNSWRKAGNGYESSITVNGILPNRPFLLDVNINGQDAIKATELISDFSLIFETRCDISNDVAFRASDQPAQDIPIKILVFKR